MIWSAQPWRNVWERCFWATDAKGSEAHTEKQRENSFGPFYQKSSSVYERDDGQRRARIRLMAVRGRRGRISFKSFKKEDQATGGIWRTIPLFEGYLSLGAGMFGADESGCRTRM